MKSEFMLGIRELQARQQIEATQMKAPFRSGAEIMLALTEELGEVATEVALLDQIGTKAEWEIGPSRERLATEMSNVLNLLCVLANHYDIDLDQLLAR